MNCCDAGHLEPFRVAAGASTRTPDSVPHERTENAPRSRDKGSAFGLEKDLHLITEDNKGNEAKNCRRIGALCPVTNSAKG
jgi:hypothetical protein